MLILDWTSPLNNELDGLFASEGGNEFQSLGAMYEKERSPALLWVFGITREVSLEDHKW